jgi:hypothetical protein
MVAARRETDTVDWETVAAYAALKAGWRANLHVLVMRQVGIGQPSVAAPSQAEFAIMPKWIDRTSMIGWRRCSRWSIPIAYSRGHRIFSTAGSRWLCVDLQPH